MYIGGKKMRIENKRLKTDVAVKIANKLLEVFRFTCATVGIIYTSYPSCDETINKEQENDVFYTEIHISDRKLGWTSWIKSKKESEDDLYEKHNTYYVHYKTRDYQIKFYDNPEICGYGALRKYNEETDIFCTIESFNVKNEKVFELYFTFNVEEMRFLDLYELSHQHMKIEDKILLNRETGELEESKILIIKECDTKGLIKKLENRVLAKIFTLDDTSESK